MLTTAFQPIQPKPAPPMRARQWDGTYVGATQILEGLRSVGATTRFIPEQVVPLGSEAIPATLLIRPHVPSQGQLPEVVRLLAGDWLIITDEGDIRRATAEQFDALFEFVHDAQATTATAITSIAEWIDQWYGVPGPSKSDLTAENDPVAVAVDTVARRAVSRATGSDTIEWEDFPEIGEHDWERVLDRVSDLADALDPPDAEYDTAYLLLQQRATDRDPDELEGDGAA